EPQRGASTWLAVHSDGPTHRLAQSLADGEAEPCAPVLARGRGVRLGKRLEQSAATVGRDPDPRVGHLEPKDRPSADAAGPAHADRHAALVRELERVAHEVQQDLA